MSEPAASERGNVDQRAALQSISRWIEKLEAPTICPFLPLASLPLSLPFWPNWNARNATAWCKAPRMPAHDDRSGDSDFLELRSLMGRYPRAAQDSHETPLPFASGRKMRAGHNCRVRSHRLLILMSQPRERRYRQRSGHCARFPPSPFSFGRLETIGLSRGYCAPGFAEADHVDVHGNSAWTATRWATQAGHDAQAI